MAKTDNLYRTPTEWTESNPVLAAGQVGKERFTNKHKIGDGNTPWNKLQYEVSRKDITQIAAEEAVIDGGAP